MKRFLVVFFTMTFILATSGVLLAEEDESLNTIPEEPAVSQLEQLKAERKQAREEAVANRRENKGLRSSINETVKTGDPETAEEFKSERKAFHQENIQAKQQDTQAYRENKAGLKSGIKETKSSTSQSRKATSVKSNRSAGVGRKR